MAKIGDIIKKQKTSGVNALHSSAKKEKQAQAEEKSKSYKSTISSAPSVSTTTKTPQYPSSPIGQEIQIENEKSPIGQEIQISQPSLLERLTNAAKSMFSGVASNAASAWGTLFENTKGTSATSVYEDQLKAVNAELAAAQSQLASSGADDPMQKFFLQDIDRLTKQKEIYEKSISANRNVGSAAIEAADEAAQYSQQQREEATRGLGPVASAAANIGMGIGEFALEKAATPFLPSVSIPASTAGAVASGYREQAVDTYDPQKALAAAGIGAAGYFAGNAASRAVGNAGLSLMKNFGVQNKVLPNILSGGASGLGFSAGTTGANEIAKALTYENYEPDWQQLGTDAVAAFAFGAISSGIRIARTSGQNKAYVQALNEELKRRYEFAKQTMKTGTPEQKAQGASSVMNGVDQLRTALKDLQFVGAQKQVDSINAFLDSIDSEMAQYLKNAAASPAGFVPPVSASSAAPAAPATPVQQKPTALPVEKPATPPAQVATTITTPPVSSATTASAPKEQAPKQEQPTEEEEVFPPSMYEEIEREPAPEPETPGITIPSGNASDLDAVANTLGERGKKAITAFYDSDIPTDQYAEDFVKAYNAGVTGAERPAPQYVGEPISVAAYFAGQNDAPKVEAKPATESKPVETPKQIESKIESGQRVPQENISNEQFETLSERDDISMDADGNVFKASPETHIDQRSPDELGNRKINSFQFDHPELHDYFSSAASALLEELSVSEKGGQLIKRGDEFVRTKRGVTENIAKLLDEYGLSYEQIEKALQAIIADNGQENYAAAKRVELVLDDMLSNGYLSPYGEVSPNEDYISEKSRIPGAVDKESPAEPTIPEELDAAPAQEPKRAETPAEKPAAPQEKPSTAQQQIADSVLPYLKKGTQFSPARLFEIADKAYGGTMAEGAYTVKDAYDGMELAVNQHLMSGMAKDANGDAATAKAFLSKMETLLSNLPTQTKRTEEMESFQQFSTPPNIAYLAAWTANIKPSDVVLEPSAGIGGLALWPKAWGATVYANELSTRRLEFLKQLGLDGTFNLNAEQIDNLLPDNIKPSVVIMNPPFSSTAGRTNTNKTANAKRHIEQALERLEPGGRLVAILGRGMSEDASSFKSWWADLKKEYNVRANIQIAGKNYKKYGTTFDVQLVVIDKTGATAGKTLTGTYEDLSAIPDLMEGIRNERQATVRSGDAVAERTPGTVSLPGSSKTPGRAARPSSAGVPAGKRRGVGGAGVADGTRAGRSGAVRTKSAGDGKPVPESAGRADGGRLDAADGGARMALSRSAGADLDGRAAELTAKNVDSTYSAYVPQKVHIKGAKKHPAKLVESAAMAAVEPPDPNYTPALPERIATEGILSDAQLENVVYAGQAHSQKLADGRRKGFFIGDGTGVGKGRQIAGIIMDNFMQGRKKAVWISEKASLLEDAKRDWKDLGGDPADIIDMKNAKLLKTGIQAESGIVFAPYTTLRSQKEARLKMLKDWLGEDFDGVIALDEAHNMGNSISMKKGRGRTKPAAQAIAGIELQQAFPDARVLYASATGATDISQYGYLERLGLWGKGTAFNNLNDFIEKISNGGLAAMELVARDMKSMGVYMARSISYEDAKYDTLQHDLTPMQTEIYNAMSRAWQKVLQNVGEALKVTGADKNGQARGAAYSAIFSGQQRFYNQILTSMSMPTVIEDMKKELAVGRSVVLQLTNTNEAQATRAIAKNEAEGGDLDDIDLTPSEMLKDLLEKSFPVTLYEEYTDEEGRLKSRMVTDQDGNPVIDKKAVRMRDNLIAELGQMKVPDGPLEMLFDAFGVENVAEVTGRTQRIVEKEDASGEKHRVREKRGPTAGLADTKMFQDGKKRILVFSEAGGTGKSYHADLRAKNQQQRVHYLLQAGWNASKAVQGFGRTLRSNQASAPIYRLVTTNVMGQKRFTSTIARRLDNLGALTKGQRQAGSGVFSEKDNLENPIAADALSQYYKVVDKEVLKKLGLYDKLYDENGRINESSDDLRNVSKFLNRILSLEVDEQNEVFQGFYDTFERMLDAAIANGTVDMGLENYRAEKINVVDEKVIRTDKSGADTKYVQMVAYKKPDIIEYGQVEDYGANFQNFVRMEDGSVRAVYEISSKTNAKGEVERRFKLQSPQVGKQSIYVENTLKEKTTPVPKKEWKTAWESEMKRVPEYTETTLHMLTGTLLPIWDRLPTSNTRVMRVVTADGRQYLGRVISPTQIDGVLRGLGANRTMQTYTPQQIQKSVIGGGKEIVFRDNRMKLVRRRVSGEWRMEITGQNIWYLPRQVSGVISERINYDYRYFVPTGEAGDRVLKEIMDINPVVEIRSADPEVDAMAGGSAATASADYWKTTRVGDTKTAPKSLSEIVESIRHHFGINITVGKIRSKGTLGQYNRRDYGVRTRVANDLPTISHELGHHLDNTYGLTKNLKGNALNELIDNMDDSFRRQYKREKWKTEGLAEFVRKFLTNRDEAAIEYPEFTDYFMSKLSEKDAAFIDQLADDVNASLSLDTETAQSSIRLMEEKGPDARTASEKIKDMGDSFYQAWVDANNAIKLFDERAGSDVYTLAANAAYSDAVAGNIILGELRDINGNYVGPGLKTVLHGINTRDKTEYKEFAEYLIVKHGPERLKEGMKVFSSAVKDNPEWMEARQAELEAKYPEFKAASERLYDFQRNLLQTWNVDVNMIDQKTFDEWTERWKFYVPFNRAFDEDVLRKGAKRGFANQKSIFKNARGSGRDIIHPVDNIMSNLILMVNVGVRNNVFAQLTNVAGRVEGLADLIEKVPATTVPKVFDTKEMKKLLTGAVTDSELSAEDKDIMLDMIVNMQDMMIQYGRGKAYGNTVTVMKNGKPEFWKVNDPDLLESLTSLSPGKMNGVLDAYAVISRFMTGNITGKNLLWSIFSNAPRDIMTLFVYSKDKNPLHVFGGMASSYVNNITGGENDPFWAEFLSMGGGHTSVYSSDRDLAKKARKQITRKKTDYLNPMDWIVYSSDMIESGPRFATYKMMRLKGMDPQHAFREAMDITVDFRRGGRMSRDLNKAVPFFSASVQGQDKFARWIRAKDVPPEQRKKVIRSRTISFLIASSALAALFYGINNSTDEKKKNYQQLSNYTKNSYWVFPMKNGKYFAIPKPRELAVLSSFFETAAEMLEGENEHAFDGFYEYLTNNLLPPGLSEIANLDVGGALGSFGLFGTLSYLVANRDFLGRPIESSGMLNLEPKDRYTSRTSLIAKEVGEAFNISPQKLDFFFGSVLGGFWKTQKALFPVGGENRDLTMGIQGSYVKDSQYSTDLVNWMYDKAEKSNQKANSDFDNMEKAIEKKMDANMTSFYSRYYSISKNVSDTVSHRSTRQTVLDMIREYQKAYDLGSTTQAQKVVYGVCERAGSTEYLPSVMQVNVKDGNGVSHTLSDVQYVEYQLEYLGLYWETAEDVLSGAKQADQEKLLKYAKETAKEQATNRVLKRIGAPIFEEYDYGNIPLSHVAEFGFIYGTAESEKDEDGKTISGSKQENVIKGIDSISGLTDEQKSILYRSVYDSDKNNPWAEESQNSKNTGGIWW